MTNNENLQSFVELQPGTILNNGKYVIEKKIGAGGFGITYKATQIGLNRTVCIKEYFLAGKCTRNTRLRTVIAQENPGLFEKYRAAFVKEAKMLDELNHPNIVNVIDVFDENNTSYMVMAFIQGTSLQDIVEKNGPLQYAEAINYIGQITNAIDFVHQQHILHRDIKPDNIMITSDYKAVLIDFGNAREFEHDKTQMHTSIFTRCYAPIEQYEANSRKGSYTDIYAIGATLYFILTGKEPLEAGVRAIEKMPTPKELCPNIPEEINRTIMKAMQIKPENRHQTVKGFMDDLLNIRPSKIVDETIGSGKMKKKWLLISLVAVIVAVVAGVVLATSLSPDKEDENIVKTEDFTGMGMYPMIKVEGGSFMMGNSKEEDATLHKVQLDDFYIGQCEVSRALWLEIMGYDNSEYPADDAINPRTKKQYTQDEIGKYPVTNVSYDEVQTFINKLNKKTGKCFALPTEAQWEYAARGGNKNSHEYFSCPKGANIWCDKPVLIGVVSSLVKPNDLGIYHMTGNAAEWCRDFYANDFYEKSPSKEPVNTTESGKYVVRGGSFESVDFSEQTLFHRVAKRDREYSDLGFRMVLLN